MSSRFRVSKSTQTQCSVDPSDDGFLDSNSPATGPGMFLTRIVPVTGIVSFHAFALHVFHPRCLSRFISVNTGIAAANGLLMHSHVSTAIYLFYRPHLSRLPSYRRLLFSVYGSLLFNLGSVLLWASSRVLLSDKPWIVRSIVALSSAISLALVGNGYINYIDNFISSDV